MIQLLVLFCFLTAPVLSVSDDGNELNTRYIKNDAIISNALAIYNNFAQTSSDSYNTQKRCFTIMLCGVFQLMAQNGEGSFNGPLNATADVISLTCRGAYDVLRITLDPALQLVQSSCRPTTTSEDCENGIITGLAKLTKECGGFLDHWKFYEATAEIIEDDDFNYFQHKILNATLYCTNDENALEFQKQWLYGSDFDAARVKMINWYTTYSNGSYPCYLPPLQGYCSA